MQCESNEVQRKCLFCTCSSLIHDTSLNLEGYGTEWGTSMVLGFGYTKKILGVCVMRLHYLKHKAIDL